MEKFEKEDYPFRGLDGHHYPTMDNVENANKTYWDYKNPYIINKVDTIFNAPLTQKDLERIASSPTYLELIALIEERFALSAQIKRDNPKITKR